jgi:hypothetical protein
VVNLPLSGQLNDVASAGKQPLRLSVVPQHNLIEEKG